jgi:hypothetical protein
VLELPVVQTDFEEKFRKNCQQEKTDPDQPPIQFSITSDRI